VTHTAEVDVNSAFIKAVGWPALLANGSISNKVPIAIIPAKPYTSVHRDAFGVRVFFNGETKTRQGFNKGTRYILSAGLAA
jgi:hypothetical protein